MARRLPNIYEGRAEDSYKRARWYEISERDEAVSHCALYYLSMCDTYMGLAFLAADVAKEKMIGAHNG